MPLEKCLSASRKPLSVRTSAPAKVILFGEHAVLYGQPAVAVAIDLRMRMEVTPSAQWRVNAYPMSADNAYRHRQIAEALELYWPGGGPGERGAAEGQAESPDEAGHPLHFRTQSEIPSASGLGSSSAFTVAAVGAISEFERRVNAGQEAEGTDEGASPGAEEIARRSWAVEWASHGKASPLDTACAALGGGVVMTPGGGDEGEAGAAVGAGLPPRAKPLWRAEREGQAWQLASLEIPPLQLVIGYSGAKSKTGPQVAKVARFAGHSGFAKDILGDIGELARRGLEALDKGELARVGALMKANHDLLTILGVNTPQTQRLYMAASRHALGAKLTGAGGGGSIIALLEPDDAEGVAAAVAALRRAGGKAMVVAVAQEGLRVEAPISR